MLSGKQPAAVVNAKPKRRPRRRVKDRHGLASYYGRCRSCGAERHVGKSDWRRTAQPRCYLCGGMLEKLRLSAKALRRLQKVTA